MVLRVGSALVTAALLAACGSADDADAPSLIATTGIWADVTSRVACGEQVAAMIPAGADPHSFEPSLRDRELLERADLVVANGSGLEATMSDLLTTADTTLVEVATHVDLIHESDEDEHEEEGNEEDGDGHAHEAGDPHIWLDPTRVAGTLDVIASALVGRDPAAIRRCADAYRVELEQLDAQLAELVDTIPPAERLLVTNHDSLAYFADQYGFDVIGTVVAGTSTIAETNAAGLQRLADNMGERGVRTIFVDEAEPDADARALADRTGATIVPLRITSLTESGPSATYTGMLLANAELIVEALRP